MDTQDNDIIIEKVRKLLALSGSPNQAEATRAAEKAREMITKYNLSADDLGPEEEVCRYGVSAHRIKPAPWKLILAEAVSEFYFCRFLLVECPDGFIFQIIGRRHHAMIAASMLEYIEKAVIRISREKIRKNAKLKFRNSFKYGMACEIRARLLEMKREKERLGPADEKSLIVREDERVEEFLNSIGAQSFSIKKPLSKNAFNQGVDAGSSVQLGEQLGHNTRRIAR